MSIQVALAGNPNSGKTTLFNALTGANQFVGNWPGVTVEKKEGKYKGDKEIKITDLPGIYSLSPYTLEEVVSREYLLNEKVDVILNIVDGSNLERNLYLTTQLLELGIPVVVAINMLDVIEKRGDKVNYVQLSKELGCPVMPISALKNKGIDEVMAKVKESAHRSFEAKNIYDKELNSVLDQLSHLLPRSIDQHITLFYSIKLFERDDKIISSLNTKVEDESLIQAIEKKMDDDSESIITDARYSYITKIIKDCYVKANREGLTTSDKIDRFVTNRILALPIFALVMFIVYYVSVTSVGTFVTDWTNGVLFGEMIPPAIEGFLVSINCAAWLQSLILDGIVAGVGAVLGFVPQMLVLFIFLAILEDCGYMARVAFIMDRIFRKFGLSGKSFIPMLIGSGCGVPGIMASRTIESDRDRKMTIVLTPFMSCSAKLPIYGMIIAAFFPSKAAIVMITIYCIGILVAVVSALLLKNTIFLGEPVPFVLELPAYRIPTAKNVMLNVWDKAKDFIRKAFTVIFIASIVIWFLQSFNFQFEMIEDSSQSILAAIGTFVSPIFKPLGFNDWRASTALMTGITAKESVVSTLSVLTATNTATSLNSALAGIFTPMSAFAFLVFTVLYMPCIAAFAATKRELGSWLQALLTAGFQTGMAYLVAMLIYQIGNLFL